MEQNQQFVIRRIAESKENYLDLLLIGDEQSDMVLRYLERGELFALQADGRVCGVCVVTDEGDAVCELKNIAVLPDCRRRGYARALIDYVCDLCRGNYSRMIVGTGETPSMFRFYEHCGFEYSHRIEGFFTDNYDHPIVEEGIILKDMIYFAKKL